MNTIFYVNYIYINNLEKSITQAGQQEQRNKRHMGQVENSAYEHVFGPTTGIK